MAHTSDFAFLAALNALRCNFSTFFLFGRNDFSVFPCKIGPKLSTFCVWFFLCLLLLLFVEGWGEEG